MRISVHPKLAKQLLRRTARDRRVLMERLLLFETDPHNHTLRNHPLLGKWYGYRSINLTGDLRAIFRLLNSDHAIFVEIGTHSELYD